jgi:DNA gyrase/topoisomerase IV subunit B
MSNAINIAPEYTADTIESYENLMAIRQRPTVFIQFLGQEGVMRVFNEIIGNSIDEFTAGRGNIINVSINNNTHVIIVEDFASGIPIEKFEDVTTKIFAGGKFGKSSYGGMSRGLNGLGLKCGVALSSYLIADTYRGGKRAHGEYKKGVVEKIEYLDENPSKHGTRIEYSPDPEVFGDIGMPKHTYIEFLEIIACINSGLQINFTYNNEKPIEFLFPEGMEWYMRERIIKAKKLRVICPILRFEDYKEFPPINEHTRPVRIKYLSCITWADNLYSEHIRSFANSLETIEHGTHVTGMRMALTDSIKRFIQSHELLPKSSKLEISGNDVRDSCCAIITATHSNPTFSTQVKDSLSNQDMQHFVRASIINQFSSWLEANNKIAGEICKLVIRTAKARAAAKEAKDNIIKSSGKLNFIDINPKKYNGCKSNNPEECELFIVEGDSAGGNAQDARDTRYQAIFRVRGKIQNTLTQRNIIFSEELKQLSMILGSRPGEEFDIRKLRFHKIVKGVDADSDGYHISTLIDGFILKYYRQIVEAGYLYESKPPLYQIRIGSGKKNEKSVFIPDERYFQKTIAAIATGITEFATIKGKKLSNELMKVYIRKIQGFKDFLDGYATQINISPSLLEFIIRYYKDIIRGDFSGLEALGFYCTVLSNTNNWMHINIDRDYEHYFLVIDELFYNNIYKPIYKRLCDIYITDVKFKGKKTGSYYGGTTYLNAAFLDNMLLGGGVKVRRLKGLGESSAAELRYFLFNPKTRIINKLRLKDVAYAEKQFDIFLGSNREEKKKLFI